MALYKRSHFLIDPPFQLKFSLIVSSLIIISSLIYPVIMVDFLDEIIAVNSSNPAKSAKIMAARNELIYYLVFVQIIFSALVFILFIFMTHKIAGPLYKLKAHLAGIREGEPISQLNFRYGDHFQDVADEVSLFLETLRINQESDFHYLEEVSLYIENLVPLVPDDKKPVLNEISRRLMDIKFRYKKDL